MTEVIVPSNFETTTTPVYYTTIEVVKPAPKPISKKEELIESLDYLKNKKDKTKHDKDSIDILNAVLKNM